MENVSYQVNEIQNRRLILGIAFFLGISVMLSFAFHMPALLSLVLAAQVVIFFSLFNRPVWAIAALLIGQLTVSNYVFYVSDTLVSIRFIWTIMAVLLLIPILRKEGKIQLGGRAKRVIIPAVILIAVAIISNIVNTDLTNTIEYVRQISTSLAVLILLPAVVKNEKDIKTLATVALITCAVSAFFAVVQHYHFNLLPFSTLYGGTVSGRRAIGFSDSAVNLAYTLPLVILPAISLLFFKGINPRYRVLTVLAILVMTAALYFTFTRSGIYSLGLGLIAIVFITGSKFRKELFLVVLVLCAAFIVYVDMKENRYSQGFSEEDSAASRLVLWQAGAKIAVDYPVLGIGSGGFKEMSQAYMSSVEYDPEVVDVEGVLGVEQPHNDFLRIWISYGTVALIAFIWLLFSIFHNFLETYRTSSRRFVKGIAIGGFAALAAYVVNAACHNVMDTVWLLWIIGGLSIAAYKLAEQKRRNSKKVLA